MGQLVERQFDAGEIAGAELAAKLVQADAFAERHFALEALVTRHRRHELERDQSSNNKSRLIRVNVSFQSVSYLLVTARCIIFLLMKSVKRCIS